MTDSAEELTALLGAVHHQLARAGQTVAVAESLTGGLIAAALTRRPGASTVFRGAVVAYHDDVKEHLVGVGADLLAREGAVSPDVASELAAGARTTFGADWGIGATGVAGPDPVGRIKAGTAFVAVAGPGGHVGLPLRLGGGREQVRDQVVLASVRLLAESLAAAGPAFPGESGSRCESG
jgi:nicotinamide-nucleotide amidase